MKSVYSDIHTKFSFLAIHKIVLASSWPSVICYIYACITYTYRLKNTQRFDDIIPKTNLTMKCIMHKMLIQRLNSHVRVCICVCLYKI